MKLSLVETNKYLSVLKMAQVGKEVVGLDLPSPIPALSGRTQAMLVEEEKTAHYHYWELELYWNAISVARVAVELRNNMIETEVLL